jgi:flagellar basal-body rod protein FlgC
MGLFSSINVASSGLTAQRTRLDVIANNIANADSTRTTEGGPFRRSRVVFRPMVDQPYWRGPYLPTYLDNNPQRGVRIVKIDKDYDSQPRTLRTRTPSSPGRARATSSTRT